MCKNREVGADKKREKHSGLPCKLNADSVYMIFFHITSKKGKDEKLREINIVGLAAALVSFGGM